jgi:tetratricopeptide (TPR) repeat protein
MEFAHASLPDPEQMGYEDSLAAGLAAREYGAPLLASRYLTRAVALRATQFALVQLAALQRDLGLARDAEDSYRRALSLPGTSEVFAKVGLAAVLCDERKYEEALELAREALDAHPQNAAALAVAARALEEVLQTLGPGVDAEAAKEVRRRASGFRQTAAQFEPESEDWLRERRNRAIPLHLVTPTFEPETPIEQGLLLTDEPSVDRCDAMSIAQQDTERSVGWLRRFWRRLRLVD